LLYECEPRKFQENLGMPFYEYQCTMCKHCFKALQKIHDRPLVYCPECGKSSLKKMISAVAFHLKGTGWYKTDFKNNDKKPDTKKSDNNTLENKSENLGCPNKTGDSSDSVKSEKYTDFTTSTSSSSYCSVKN